MKVCSSTKCWTLHILQETSTEMKFTCETQLWNLLSSSWNLHMLQCIGLEMNLPYEGQGPSRREGRRSEHAFLRTVPQILQCTRVSMNFLWVSRTEPQRGLQGGANPTRNNISINDLIIGLILQHVRRTKWESGSERAESPSSIAGPRPEPTFTTNKIITYFLKVAMCPQLMQMTYWERLILRGMKAWAPAKEVGRHSSKFRRPDAQQLQARAPNHPRWHGTRWWSGYLTIIVLYIKTL